MMAYRFYVATVFLFFSVAYVSGCGSEAAQDGQLDMSYCEANPVAAPGQLCASIALPADMPAAPEKVSFHFFDAFPPFGPPSLMGLELATQAELADFVAGAEVPMILENLPSEGEGFLYVAVYMPDGGATTWVAVPGVDYVGFPSDEAPVSFTGEPINLMIPISLALATE